MSRTPSKVLLSHRQLESLGPPAYIAGLEAEDVLAAADGDFEIVSLTRQTLDPVVRARRAIGWGLRSVAGNHRRVPRLPRLGSGSGSGPADHVIFMARSPAELALLEGFRAAVGSRTVLSVWMIELWQSTLKQWITRNDGFGYVDNIFVGNPDAVEPLRVIAPKARVEYVPAAVDVLRFAPEDPTGPRPISILQLGRRDDVQHRLLLEIAGRHHIYYHYDTIVGEAIDWLEHRNAVGDLYRLAAVAVCNYAKHDMPEVIGSQRLISSRLFEGLAAGSVLIGHPPVDQSQQELFGRTVVHQIEAADDLERQLEEFMDPDATRGERIANVQLALRGHDWGHRWKYILEALDLPVPEGLTQRLAMLAARADSLNGPDTLSRDRADEPGDTGDGHPQSGPDVRPQRTA